MAEPTPDAPTEAALLRTFKDGLESGAEVVPGSIEVMAEHFVGQSVDVRQISETEVPITAYCFATPYPAFGTRGYRPQHGLLVRENPHRARGTIEEVDLVEARLKIKPRRTSLYRLDKGFFLVNILNEAGEPLVKLKLLEPSQ